MKESFKIAVGVNLDHEVLDYINTLIMKHKTLENYFELNYEEYDFIIHELERMDLNILKIHGLPMNYIIITGVI